MDTTITDGILTVVSTERIGSRILPSEADPGPQGSLVIGNRKQLDLPVCRDADGVSRGQWSSTGRS